MMAVLDKVNQIANGLHVLAGDFGSRADGKLAPVGGNLRQGAEFVPADTTGLNLLGQLGKVENVVIERHLVGYSAMASLSVIYLDSQEGDQR